MGLGLVALVAGLVRGDDDPPGASGAIVVVGDVALGPEEVASRITTDMLEAGRLDPVQVRTLLDSLVVETLVLQEGIAMGLPRTDGIVRNRIAQIVRQVATADVDTRVPTDAELRAFHAAHRDLFVGPDRYRVAEVFVPERADQDAAERAAAAAAALAEGADFETVQARYGTAPPVDWSAELHPIDVVARRMGEAYARAVRATAVGATSPPVRSPFGMHVLRVLEHARGVPLPFEACRDAVRIRLRRAWAQQALADYLDELRARTTIWIAPDATERLQAIVDGWGRRVGAR